VSQRDRIQLDSSREPNDSDQRKGLDGTDGPSDEVVEEVLRVFWNLASALMKVASKAFQTWSKTENQTVFSRHK
jgi:hypothetical protein